MAVFGNYYITYMCTSQQQFQKDDLTGQLNRIFLARVEERPPAVGPRAHETV